MGSSATAAALGSCATGAELVRLLPSPWLVQGRFSRRGACTMLASNLSKQHRLHVRVGLECWIGASCEIGDVTCWRHASLTCLRYEPPPLVPLVSKHPAYSCALRRFRIEGSLCVVPSLYKPIESRAMAGQCLQAMVTIQIVSDHDG